MEEREGEAERNKGGCPIIYYDAQLTKKTKIPLL